MSEDEFDDDGIDPFDDYRPCHADIDRFRRYLPLDIPLEALTPSVVLVDISSEANMAVAKLRKSEQCAVDCEGESLSRKGRLHLLQVGASGGQEVYVFDLQALGPEGYEATGLKAFLEDPAKVKLMWDCREDADALLHQFNTTLKGVYDLQLEEVLTRPDDDSRRLSRLYGIVPPGSLRSEQKSYTQHYRLRSLEDFVKNPAGKKPKVCNYASKGQCRYGATCAYAHAPDELADQSADAPLRLPSSSLTGATVSCLVSERPLRRDVLMYAAGDIQQLHRAHVLLQERSALFDRAKVEIASGVYCDVLRCMQMREFTLFESSSLLPCAILPDICGACGCLRCELCGRSVAGRRKKKPNHCGPCGTLFRWRKREDSDGDCYDDGRGYGLLNSEGEEI
uniref:C3H1-type domain-containing protein n=1 Tax=Alexandrium catenella TaxID=2925 RepID=A0A7S1RDU8_ALECA|mmetsp:Transcript_53899/g.144364  ORF Transcript_53899/g.144364 Transcript_53899/m.144364 type:complete len:395 (+) Transcript_53899:56-1240(+)